MWKRWSRCGHASPMRCVRWASNLWRRAQTSCWLRSRTPPSSLPRCVPAASRSARSRSSLPPPPPARVDARQRDPHHDRSVAAPRARVRRTARGAAMTRVTIFDYGAGNLHSLAKALSRDGVSPRVEADPLAALDTDVLVLPGVGNFALAAERLAPGRDAMQDAIRRGLPTLGVCLGMQLL